MKLFDHCCQQKLTNLLCDFLSQRLEEPRYDIMWADKENYVKLIIHPSMLSDHMPDRVMKVLGKVFLQEPAVQEV